MITSQPCSLSLWQSPHPSPAPRSGPRLGPLPVQDKVEVVRSVTGRLLCAAARRQRAQEEHCECGRSPLVPPVNKPPLPRGRPPKLSRHVFHRSRPQTKSRSSGTAAAAVCQRPPGPAAFREAPQRRQQLGFYIALTHDADPSTRRNPLYPEDRARQNRPNPKGRGPNLRWDKFEKVRPPSRVHEKLVNLTTAVVASGLCEKCHCCKMTKLTFNQKCS